MEYGFIPDDDFEKPMTNGDRIRPMSDEEMAGWLERIRLCCGTDLCGRGCPLSEICYSNAETLDWLKEEEAKDDA